MNKDVTKRILTLQDSLKDNPAYQALVAEHEILNARFLETVNTLAESQREAIFDYIGLLIEMHTKQLERACEQ